MPPTLYGNKISGKQIDEQVISGRKHFTLSFGIISYTYRNTRREALQNFQLVYLFGASYYPMVTFLEKAPFY